MAKIKFPPGAIKSRTSFLNLCKKINTFYLVDDDPVDRGGLITKIKVRPPFISGLVFVDNLGGRYLEINNLVKGDPAWKNNFIFANYWHALAYSLKCKQKEKSDERVA